MHHISLADQYRIQLLQLFNLFYMMNRNKSHQNICAKKLKTLINLYTASFQRIHSIQNPKTKSRPKDTSSKKLKKNIQPSKKSLKSLGTHKLIENPISGSIGSIRPSIQSQQLNIQKSDFINRQLLKQKIQDYVIKNHIVKDEDFSNLHVQLVRDHPGYGLVLHFLIGEIVGYLDS